MGTNETGTTGDERAHGVKSIFYLYSLRSGSGAMQVVLRKVGESLPMNSTGATFRKHSSAGVDWASWVLGIGLVLTFVLSTVSGFMLGGNQPPAGQGLPVVGWHLYKDIRPAHFLGVHAQQLIPLCGLIAVKFLGYFSTSGLVIGSVLYLMLWVMLTGLSL